MAKNNNLTDFLTDVADAIRAKKGTTGKINPQDFSSEIASIETGGGGTSGGAVSKSDVNFYDYDGTLLHSYTKDEFLALSALPDLPTRKGLICQEWNYTLDNAKEYVTDYGVLDIGATYITDDGKTRLYIKIAAKGRMTVPLYFSQTVARGVTIDWGDGSATQTLSGTGYVNTSHTYSNIGDYVITLNPISKCTLGLGHNSTYYCVMGSTENNGKVYCNMLQAVEIGKNVNIDKRAFTCCYSLKSIVIPNGVTKIGDYAFHNCSSLTSIVIPDSVTSINDGAFYYGYSLTIVVIPNDVTYIGNYAFIYCTSLTRVVIPDSVTNIGNYAFSNGYSLKSIVIPNGVTKIGNRAFNECVSLASVVIPDSGINIRKAAFSECFSLTSIMIPNDVINIHDEVFCNCYSLTSIVIPDSVTDIGSGAFSNCYGMASYDFRASKSVPTLSNDKVFTAIPSDCKIVVPDSLYSSWIKATNWSTYASQIVKASEFNG